MVSGALKRRSRLISQRTLQAKQLPQALRLRPADRQLGVFAIVHAKLVGALEPGQDLLDPVDVHHVRAMGSPEEVGIKGFKQFFQRPAVGMSFHAGGRYGDHAFVDRGETYVLLIHQDQPSRRSQQDLLLLRLLLLLQKVDERFQTLTRWRRR